MRYLVGVFFAAECILIFRLHYYSGWLMAIAFICLVILPGILLDEKLTNLSQKVFAHKWFADKLATMVYFIIIAILVMVTLLANSTYCIYLLEGKTQTISSSFKREYWEKGRRTIPQKVREYEYQYNGSKYCKKLYTRDYAAKLGDNITLIVSTFDPTVSEMVVQ